MNFRGDMKSEHRFVRVNHCKFCIPFLLFFLLPKSLLIVVILFLLIKFFFNLKILKTCQFIFRLANI